MWLEKEPGWFEQLFRTMDDSEQAAPDAFSRMAARPQMLLARGLADAQQILAGPAIQARCLDCPATTLALRRSERLSLGAWLAGLIGR